MKSENKYWEFTEEEMHHFGHRLRRIRALVDLPDRRVKKGETGGWVSDSAEISGLAWVYDEAKVYENARITDSAEVSGSALVYGSAWVAGSARVREYAGVSGKARIYGSAQVYGCSEVLDKVCIYGSAQVYGFARIYDKAQIYDQARVAGSARVYGLARVGGTAGVYDGAEIFSSARVEMQTHVMTLTSIGSEDATVNLVRTEDGHYLQVGCWEGTAYNLMEEVYRRSGRYEKWLRDETVKQQWIEEYQALEMLAMKRVTAWEKARGAENRGQVGG